MLRAAVMNLNYGTDVFTSNGIKVGEVRYLASQPWPFPDSLMIGFTAEYESGDIKIDETELAEAAWFSRESLPLIPDSYTIARELINRFCEK